ncbi:MAG: hypothetical protein GY940_28300 [bacterium]|nr:hypothetical protein [bacterium]
MNVRFNYLVILSLLMVLLFACGGGGNKEFEELYNNYRKAIEQEDLAALKEVLTTAGQREMLGEGAAGKLKMVKAMTPSGVSIKKSSVSGDTAVLEVEGQKMGQRMEGKVILARENGTWKIEKEQWQINIDLDSGGGQPGFTGDVVSFMADPKKPPSASLVLTGHQGGVSNLSFTPDGRYLVSASYSDYSLRLWDPATGRELSSARTPKRVRSIAISPDGAYVLTADAYKNIRKWPIIDGTIGDPQTLSEKAGDSLALSPDGKYIAATAFKKEVVVLDAANGSPVETLAMEPDRRVLAFSRSGKLLAGGGQGNTYSIWDTNGWKEKRYDIRKVDRMGSISSIHFSPDGKYLATGHTDSSIVIFDLEEREELHNFFVRDSATNAVRFSPDNRLLATAQNDKRVYLWEVKTGQYQAVLGGGHGDAVKSLSFSPDGSALATGGDDRKIIIWRSGPAPASSPEPGISSSPPPATPPSNSPDGSYQPKMEDFEGHPNLLGDMNAHRVTPAWKTKGEVSVEFEKEDNYFFSLRYNGVFWQDAPINPGSAGQYALLICWGSSERINPNGEQTGLPYLYGYMLKKGNPNKINAYLQGQKMLLTTQTANEWGVMWGIFKIPPDTGAIRFFMQQADGKQPQNGSVARFDEPGIFIFNSEAEAQQFAKNY